MQAVELDLGEKLSRINELLEADYRSVDLGNLDDPLAEAVYILISQHTSKKVYRSVFAKLRQRYPRWRDLMGAPVEDLEALLRPVALYRNKAKQLKAMLQKIGDVNAATPLPGRRRDLNLDFLRKLPAAEAEKFLNDLLGIGTKSAGRILWYSLGYETFAVDTNVRRILVRIGLLRPASRQQDYDSYEETVPPRMRKQLHMNLVHHGQAVCRGGGKPRCGECILISFCEQGRKTLGTVRPARIRRKEKRPPVAVDLFSGAGGLGYGFRQAGFRIALAIEADRSAAQTYRLNNPGTVVIEAQIDGTTTGPGLMELMPGVERVSVLLAGPPCQGYSAAGARQPDDPKNYLFQHVARIAGELGVDVAVMENVPGMRNVGGRSFIDAVKDAFRAVGMEANHRLLRASDFGVPQHRHRIFFLVEKQGLTSVSEPKSTHLRNGEKREPGDNRPCSPTVMQVLQPLPRLSAGQICEWTVLPDGRDAGNLSTMAHSDEVRRKIRNIKPGNGPISYRRLHTIEARTIIAGHRALPVHPTLHRTISVREAASIQGFPVDYFFCGFRSEQPLQVANAVPPPLAHAVANHVNCALRNEQPPY